MQPISRRSLFQLSGAAVGTLGAAGVVGGLLPPAQAARRRRRKVRASLSASVVPSGELLTLTIVERLKQPRRIRVKDSSGLVWTRSSRTRRSQVWTARPTAAGSGMVTVVVRRKDGKVFRREVPYEVVSTTITTVAGVALIGMSAPGPEWDQRVSQVGPGLGARRIFADLADGADSQIRLVEEAHAAGLLPVISYKVGGDVAGAVAGRFNEVARQAAAKLASYGLPTAVSFWHEPYGDLTGEQHAAASRQILPAFKQGELRVGPILNGWLLDNKVDDFSAYCPEDLFSLWDWVGLDTYEGGTAAAPGQAKPADRIPALSSYLAARGHPTMPIGIGEYNGYSPATIAAAGAAILDTPHVWFGCMWNSTAERGWTLEGERLAAFQQTLALAQARRAG